MKAIEIIKKSRQTHEDWLAYFEENPGSQLSEKYKYVGDVEHHKKCIEGYNQAIADIEQLQAKNETNDGFPIQDGENIPEWLAKLVYAGYVNRYGEQRSYETIRRRGGFGKEEVVWLLNCIGITTIKDAGRTLEESG